MLAMGMPPPTSTSTTTTTTTTRRPISDIDLPELPDFLRPDPTTKRPLRPIQDIDLPEGTGVIQPIEEDDQDEDQNKKEEGKDFINTNNKITKLGKLCSFFRIFWMPWQTLCM